MKIKGLHHISLPWGKSSKKTQPTDATINAKSQEQLHQKPQTSPALSASSISNLTAHPNEELNLFKGTAEKVQEAIQKSGDIQHLALDILIPVESWTSGKEKSLAIKRSAEPGCMGAARGSSGCLGSIASA